MDSIPERTTAKLTANFLDPDGAGQAPTTAAYRVDDVRTGSQIRDWTALTVSASILITVDAQDTSILDESNRVEERRVTVRGIYGAGDEVHGSYVFQVENLPNV